MLKVQGINHITFATADLERSLAFYTTVLGLELVANWGRGAYLLAGELWVCLSCDPMAKQQVPDEYTHIAFSVDQTDFSKVRKYIEENHISIWKENKSEGDSLYILDPDHNKLELHNSSLQNRIADMRRKPYSGMKLNESVIAKHLK